MSYAIYRLYALILIDGYKVYDMEFEPNDYVVSVQITEYCVFKYRLFAKGR
jgi:hypothetical protein